MSLLPRFGKKTIIFIGFLAFVMACAAYIVPLSLDWGRYENKLSGLLIKVSGASADFGSSELAIFPLPHFHINRVSANDGLFKAESIDIYPSYISIITEKPAFSKIVINKPEVKFEKYFKTAPSWKDVPFKIAAEDLVSAGDIVINSGKIIYLSGKNDNPAVREVFTDYSRITTNPILSSVNIFGDISVLMAKEAILDDVNYEIKIDGVGRNSEEVEVKMIIFSGNDKLSLEGRASDSLGGYSMLADFELSSPKMRLNSSGDINISGSGVQIDAKKIDYAGSDGTGKIDILFGSKLVHMHESLSFDFIKGMGATDIISLMNDYVADDVVNRLDLNANGIIFEGRELNDVRLSIETKDNKMNVKSFEATALSGDIFLRSSGNILTKGDGYGYEGSILSKGINFPKFLSWVGMDMPVFGQGGSKSFSINSKVDIFPGKVSIKTAKGIIGKTRIYTKAIVDYRNGKSVSAAVKMDKLDISSDSGESGLKGLSSKFEAIRNLDSVFDKFAASISIGEIIYNKDKIKKFSTLIQLGNGILNLKNLSFDSEKWKGKGALAFDGRKLNPYINAALDFERVDYEFIKDLINFKDKDKKWIEDEFDFSEFNIFSGNIKISAKEFVGGESVIKDLRADVDVDSGEIDITSFNAKLFGGVTDIKGKISTNYPSVDMVFSMKSAEIENFLRGLFGFESLSGKFSISGSLAMAGSKPSNMISSIQGKGNITSRRTLITGMDIMLLSRKVPAMKTARDLMYWVDTSLSSGRSEIDYTSANFSIAAGNIEINDMVMDHSTLERSSLRAKINIPEWKIDMVSDFLVKSRAGIIPATLTLKGNISDPEKSWNKEAIEKFWEDIFFDKN